MKHIVIVETTTSGSGLQILNTALKIDAEVTFIVKSLEKYTEIDTYKILQKIHRIIEIDTEDFNVLKNEIFKLNSYKKISGLISQTDKTIYPVSLIAEELNLPFLSSEVVSNTRNKNIFRKICSENNLPIPSFREIKDTNDNKEILSKASELGYPLILKTAIGTGSSNVFL